jgi:hypothetical protein
LPYLATRQIQYVFIAQRRRSFSPRDTPVSIWGTENTYERAFVDGFEKLAQKRIHRIYPGHGEVITTGIPELIRHSLINLNGSKIIE